LVASASVLAADQLTKRHVLAEPRFAAALARRPFVSVHCIINRRAALIPLSATWMLTAWLLCAGFALFALSHAPLAGSLPGATGIGMALGGISGNLIDLLRRRGIVDFIAIGPWPVFNLADAAIVCGFGLTIFALV
jgi:signal peptidase II